MAGRFVGKNEFKRDNEEDNSPCDEQSRLVDVEKIKKDIAKEIEGNDNA
jgi:hypothetical protein